MAAIERVYGIEGEGGRMEIKGNQVSWARAHWHDYGRFGWGFGRGRAKVTVGSNRRRGIVVEAEHEDVKCVYQGQVDVLLKSEVWLLGRLSRSFFHTPLDLWRMGT